MSLPIEATVVSLNSGFKMPVLGFWAKKNQPGKVKAAVSVAIDCGYRHFDGASVYQNEKEIGEALKKKFGEGLKREDVFVSSKLWATQHEAADVRVTIQQTLDDLQLEYLDLYFIHNPIAFKSGDSYWPKDENGKIITTNVHFNVSWREMEKAVDDGLVKSIGVCNFNSEQLKELYENSRIKPAVLQCESHPYMTQVPLINFCKERKIAFSAFSPLPTSDRPFAQPGEPPLLEDPKLVAIGKKYNKSTSQICLKFQIQRGISVVSESVDEKLIQHYSELFDFKMCEEDMKIIGNFNKNWRSNIVKLKKSDGTMGVMFEDHYLFPFKLPF